MKYIKNENINEYNILRAIAVILVIIGHCTYYQIITNYGGINYTAPYEVGGGLFSLKIIQLINKFLYLFHMPLFFALSGALFKVSINKKSINSFKELVVKKFKRLIIPFILISLLYVIPIKYISGYYQNSTNIIKDIILGQILLQGNSHLWFLPTLFLIFCIMWFVKKYINKNNEKLYIIFTISLNIISFIFNINIIKYVTSYLIYFLIGYIFEDYRLDINKMKISFIKKINIINFFLIIALAILSIKIIPNSVIKKLIINIVKIIIALAISFIVYLMSYILSNFKNIKLNFLNKIAKTSFGLYLYSDPLNYLILYIIYKFLGIEVFYTEIGTIFIFIIRLIITFYISYIITNFLQKRKVKYIC